MTVVDNSIGAFGDQVTVELSPVAGWKFQYNVNSELVASDVTGAGAVTHADAKARVSTGASASSSASIQTIRVLRYIAGMGGVARFTGVFSPPADGSALEIGIRNYANKLAVGFKDGDFGIFYQARGVEKFIKQSEFNGDKFSVDYTKGNVFQIRYQWLGFGNLMFYLEELGELGFSRIHTVYYPNTSNLPSMSDSSMYGYMQATNTTNDTDVYVESPAMMLFREGLIGSPTDPLTLLRGFRVAKTINATVETPLLTVRTKETYASLTNTIAPTVGMLAMSTEGSKHVTFRVYIGATPTTGVSWADWNTTNSSLESDSSATAFTGGVFLFSYELGKSDSLLNEVQQWDFQLPPPTTFMVTAQSTNASDVAFSIVFKEGF